MLKDHECLSIAKRLFRAIDQEERRTLNKEQTVEFVVFLREHLFHTTYKESRDLPKVEAMFEQLPGESFEVKLPNEEYPEYPIISQEKRVKF